MATNLYPVRFVATISETGFQVLHDYLEKAGAPEEIKNLAQGLDLLRSYSENCAIGRGDDPAEKESAPEGLAYVTQAIDKAGSAFKGAYGIA